MISAQACRADLFALFTNGDIARINSTTGAIIDTYPSVASVSINSGFAFDGRRLYLNRNTNDILDELWAFEVATETWMPFGFLDKSLIDPLGTTQLSGIGYAPGMFGEGSLIAVSRRLAGQPSYIAEYSLFPPFGGFYLPNFPVAALPDDVDALGADYDPTTGEFWISAERVEMDSRTPVLLRADLAGNIEQELLPDLGPPAIPRGLAFDEGELFIAARHLPTASNEIHKLDRSTGAILETFVLPGGGIVAALAGGVVIPEPATVALCSMAVLLVVSHRKAVR